MNSTQNQSYSLLSQQEIDILIDFLTEKKGSLDNDVMNQQSIDKLIHLIKNDSQRIRNNLFDPLSNVDTELLVSLNFKTKPTDFCEFRCSVNEENSYIQLIAYNPETKKELAITPKILNKNNSEEWGFCISPLMFNRLARSLSLKYTTETHDTICGIYAKTIYGDASHPIPELFLPSNTHLLECLI